MIKNKLNQKDGEIFVHLYYTIVSTINKKSISFLVK